MLSKRGTQLDQLWRHCDACACCTHDKCGGSIAERLSGMLSFRWAVTDGTFGVEFGRCKSALSFLPGCGSACAVLGSGAGGWCADTTGDMCHALALVTPTPHSLYADLFCMFGIIACLP